MGRSKKQQFWFDHIEAWRSSGLTQPAYCQVHRLSLASLGYWIKRTRELSMTSKPIELVSVQLASPKTCLSAMVLQSPDGWRLTIPAGTSAAWMADVLRGLS